MSTKLRFFILAAGLSIALLDSPALAQDPSKAISVIEAPLSGPQLLPLPLPSPDCGGLFGSTCSIAKGDFGKAFNQDITSAGNGVKEVGKLLSNGRSGGNPKPTQAAAVVTPPAQQAVLGPEPPAGRKKMIFLHGMQTRYGDVDPAKVEADARRYAEARGYELEVISISGDDRAGQLKEARHRLREGGSDYGGILGFSAGGATANQLRKEFPNLDVKSVSTGRGGTGGAYFAGRPHMQQVQALAEQAEAQGRVDRRSLSPAVECATWMMIHTKT